MIGAIVQFNHSHESILCLSWITCPEEVPSNEIYRIDFKYLFFWIPFRPNMSKVYHFLLPTIRTSQYYSVQLAHTPTHTHTHNLTFPKHFFPALEISKILINEAMI